MEGEVEDRGGCRGKKRIEREMGTEKKVGAGTSSAFITPDWILPRNIFYCIKYLSLFSLKVYFWFKTFEPICFKEKKKKHNNHYRLQENMKAPFFDFTLKEAKSSYSCIYSIIYFRLLQFPLERFFCTGWRMDPYFPATRLINGKFARKSNSEIFIPEKLRYR